MVSVVFVFDAHTDCIEPATEIKKVLWQKCAVWQKSVAATSAAFFYAHKVYLKRYWLPKFAVSVDRFVQQAVKLDKDSKNRITFGSVTRL